MGPGVTSRRPRRACGAGRAVSSGAPVGPRLPIGSGRAILACGTGRTRGPLWTRNPLRTGRTHHPRLADGAG
jgi:hypothetical protein